MNKKGENVYIYMSKYLLEVTYEYGTVIELEYDTTQQIRNDSTGWSKINGVVDCTSWLIDTTTGEKIKKLFK